jgi:ABC-type phosphate transport system substrate-binding protein
MTHTPTVFARISYAERITRFVGLVLLIAVAVAMPAHRASAQGYTVIVNAAGPSTLSKSDISRIFLKKSTALTPVDQAKSSESREAFTRAILGRQLSAVVSYWQQQIFSGGDSPPVEKSSDEDVLAYVRSNPKAIGYVKTGTDLGAGIKALSVE